MVSKNNFLKENKTCKTPLHGDCLEFSVFPLKRQIVQKENHLLTFASMCLTPPLPAYKKCPPPFVYKNFKPVFLLHAAVWYLSLIGMRRLWSQELITFLLRSEQRQKDLVVLLPPLISCGQACCGVGNGKTWLGAILCGVVFLSVARYGVEDEARRPLDR